MFSYLNMPSGTTKYSFRTHRLVVLPDFQNLGIGTKLLEFFGEKFIKEGKKLFCRTTHFRLGCYFENNIKWRASGQNQVIRSNINKNDNDTQSKKYKKIDCKRCAYSFEYVGEQYNTLPHQHIICTGNLEYDIAKEWFDIIKKPNHNPIFITSVADQKVINVWEQLAKDNGIRTEVLYIKNKGQFNLNNKFVSKEFDGLLCDKNEILKLKPFKNNLKNYIGYSYKNGNIKTIVKLG